MILLSQLVLFLLCLAGSAFFSASETALLSVSLSAWDRLRSQRARLERAYAVWSKDPSLVIATLLFGNTWMTLGASVLAGALVRDLHAASRWSTAWFLTVSSIFAGGTILIVGEILPKLYARGSSESVLRRHARILMVCVSVFAPFLRGLVRIADGLKKALFHQASEPLMTAEELRQVLSDSRATPLDPVSRRMLSNLMEFPQVKVAEVMIPRSQMVAVRMEQNSDRVFDRIVRSGFSRIPVYFGNIDNILGIVYAKDLLVGWRSSGLLVLEDLLRPPYRIAPEAPISTLLQGFRQGNHLAVVTDAQGRTQGIVTIEDVVETIVGDIADEFDQPPLPL